LKQFIEEDSNYEFCDIALLFKRGGEVPLSPLFSLSGFLEEIIFCEVTYWSYPT